MILRYILHCYCKRFQRTKRSITERQSCTNRNYAICCYPYGQRNGFTPSGIQTGSLAAKNDVLGSCRIWVGGVAAGGWLATLQSIGASGLGFQGTYRLKCQCCHDVFSTKENTTQVLPGSSSEVQAKRALKFQRHVF